MTNPRKKMTLEDLEEMEKAYVEMLGSMKNESPERAKVAEEYVKIRAAVREKRLENPTKQKSSSALIESKLEKLEQEEMDCFNKLSNVSEESPERTQLAKNYAAAKAARREQQNSLGQSTMRMFSSAETSSQAKQSDNNGSSFRP